MITKTTVMIECLLNIYSMFIEYLFNVY